MFSKQSENESDDSLLRVVQARQYQKREKLLFHSCTQQPHHLDNHNINRDLNSHAGFSNANNFFKYKSSKKRPLVSNQPQFKDHQKNKEQEFNDSTVTIKELKLKSSDSQINNQIQKQILKDIEQIVQQKDKCGICLQKSSKGSNGLNYKDRNKKLIKEYEKNFYIKQSLKNKTSDQKQSHQQKGILNSLDQYKYNDADSQNRFFWNKQTANSLNSDSTSKFNFIIKKSRVQSQKKLNIQGHTVYFPFEPYEPQINYMSKVLESLDKRENAILESPTGTGKTLCLLSAALSWIQEQFLKQSKEISIIYLSRTHSQLAQVQKELLKTCFRPTMAVFGSREIFCIKQQLSQLKGRDKVQACSKGVKLYLKYGKDCSKKSLQYDDNQQDYHRKVSHQQSQELQQFSNKILRDLGPDQQKIIKQAMCSYYSNEREVLGLARLKLKNKIIPTQKIRQLGQIHKFCPYYYPHFIKPICNIFFMPYNYLLDDGLISRYSKIISSSILIFDEAHNVPEASCEGRSFTINNKTFEDAKKQINKLIKSQKMTEKLYLIKQQYAFQLNLIQKQINRCFKRISSFVAEIFYSEDQQVSDDADSKNKLFHEHQTEQKIYQMLYQRCYDHEQKIFLNLSKDQAQRDLIMKMAKQLQPKIRFIAEICDKLSETPDGIYQNMEKVASFAKKCISLLLDSRVQWIQREISHYRLMVRKFQKYWEVELVCLVPFLTMKDIVYLNPLNIILTSGTLSPLQTWQKQLGIPLPIKLINKHVINPDQLIFRIINGQNKSNFNFSYKYLQQNFKTIYHFALQSIIKLVQKIPNGVLVILPSYKIMNSLERTLQFNLELKKKIHSAKKVFFETKGDFQDLIKAYRKAALEPKGALLFCVCRGKICEGIDFPDQQCRAVIFVGIPFPNVKDPVLNEKKNHINKISKQQQNQEFSGQKWYQNLTFRSVNQSIGRVIRHIYDFGCIFLLDIRYNLPQYKAQLSKWVTPSLRAVNFTQQILQQLSDFNSQMNLRLGNKKFIKSNISSELGFSDQQIEKPQFLRSTNQSAQPTKEQQKKQHQLSFNLKIQKSFSFQSKKKPQNAFQKIMGTSQQNEKKKSEGFSKASDIL